MSGAQGEEGLIEVCEVIARLGRAQRGKAQHESLTGVKRILKPQAARLEPSGEPDVREPSGSSIELTLLATRRHGQPGSIWIM